MYIIILSLIVYLLYLEFSPKLGNILFRINSENVKVFNLNSTLNMITYPLKNITFWYIENWDLNFFIYYAIFKILYLFFFVNINNSIFDCFKYWYFKLFCMISK